MPKVSVIIPTYNHGYLIGEAIQSVLDQTFRDFEVIVVDDGSTDNTKEVISKFPVRYFYQENQGPSAARNRGIEMAQSEYIAFLDADDILLEVALEKGVEILNARPEVSLTYGQVYEIQENGRIILDNKGTSHSTIRDSNSELRLFLTIGNHIYTSTVMVRRSCLYDVGLFDLEYGRSQDFDLWVRLAKKFSFACIAEPLAKYRIHPGKTCRGRTLEEWEKTNSSILESILNDKEIGPMFSHLRRNAYFNLYSGFAYLAHARGDWKNIFYYMVKALRAYPQILFRGNALRIMYKYASLLLPHRLYEKLSILKWRTLKARRFSEPTA